MLHPKPQTLGKLPAPCKVSVYSYVDIHMGLKRVNLLFATHNLAPLGTLSAQILTNPAQELGRLADRDRPPPRTLGLCLGVYVSPRVWAFLMCEAPL